MRGTGNPNKKPEKINKILDNSKLLISNLTSNNHIDSNNINNQNTHNAKDRKKTCSQDQKQKSKALNINSKIKSQNSISPLTTNLNNLIITNQNYSNTGNLKANPFPNKNSYLVHKSAKKSFNDVSQNNGDLNSNYNDRSFEEKNLTYDNNNFKLKVYESKDSLGRNIERNGYIDTNNSNSDKKDVENICSENNNKDAKNTINNLNEHLFNNSNKNFKKNNLYLENIFDYQAAKSPEKSKLIAEKNIEKIDDRESYRGLKNKFKLEDNNNLNTSREMEEKAYPGKLTDNNANLKIMDNPFAVNPNYKPENSSEADDPKPKEVKISFNKSTKPEQKVIFTPSKPNNKSTTNSKNTSSKIQLKIGTQKINNIIQNFHQPTFGNVKGKDSKSPNERENHFNNILLTSNSNLSPNLDNHNNNYNYNSNGVNMNNFNKNNKRGNPTQTNTFKQNSNANQNKSNVINLNNHLNAFKNQQPTINTDNKEENFILQTNSNSISPNNFLNNLSNQNKNNGNCSTTNSATSNVLISSNFQHHVCHTVENDHCNRDETITVNYCNTNPNESHKINLLKFNKNANFNFTKIKENEGDKFSLKNNSLNKILQSMRGNNQPYSVNNQSTINNINGITNSNILSTNHTDNNTLLNSNNFTNNANNKANKDSTANYKKSLVMSVDLNSEKALKKSIDLPNKINSNNNGNTNTNNILTASVKDSQDLVKNLQSLSKNEKNNSSNTPRKTNNNNELNRNNKDNRLTANKIIFEDNNLNNNLDKANKEVLTYLDTEEKKENNEKTLFNARENPNRHSSIIEKSKLKKNSLSNNTYANVNNTQNNKVTGTKENRISKDLDKNNNIISSYNNKQNAFKDKNLNLKNLNNLNNDNVLKNFNYVSIGYLDNPLVSSGALISKDKSKGKNIDGRSIKKNEDEGKIEISNQKNDVLNSNSIKDIQNKLNPNNKYDLTSNKVNIINIKDVKESTNAYGGKNNSSIQNIAVAKSLNLTSKKNQVIYSISKLKKDNIDKISSVNMSNKIITNNKSSITSKNSGVVVPESKNANMFIKKDVCRIFNSDDFYERNKAKQLHLQELTNNLNNMKLNSLYSKNLSQKINQSKNIQINLYNHCENELDPDKLYNLDFNSNLKNKEKTIIIDDIEELEDESYKYSEKKPNFQQMKEDEIKNEGTNKNSKENFILNGNQVNNKISDDTFKSDILHSILNFKGFFKNNEKNLLENIYQSQDCVMQLNQLNQKLEKLKNPTKSNLELDREKITNYKLKDEEDCMVKIKDSPLKPEILKFKHPTIERERVHIPENKRINELQNPKQLEADRDYYYFQKENSFTNDKLSNKDEKYDNNYDNNKQADLTKKLNYFLAPKDKKITEEPVKKSREDYKTADSYLEKAEKTNIMKEIHFNSDVRMKRYEILLEFINSNMKEIGKMVSGEPENELKKSSELTHVKKSNENEKNEILNNNKLMAQNNFDPRHKINFSKNDDFSDAKNIYYTSYVNSLKKIDETNSNKVSSLHSKINLNSRLSNNDFNMLDNSEMKELNNFGEDAIKHTNLLESNFTNHFKEQINNLSLLLNLQNKENNNNKNQNNVTNEFESINFYKNKKDPGSSLLISSIYSDFNQDLIDESFSNNILHLISNPNQHSRVFPNGFFTTSNANNGIPNPNELYTKKDSMKPNNELSEFSKNGEVKKLNSKTNLANLNTNNLTQNQIINNIITINNNYNRSKQQLATVNDSKNNLNQACDKNVITVSKSKNELNNANLNQKVTNDVKSKNNLDKNLLTLITNNNINKLLNQNIQNPNIPFNKINSFPRSEVPKTNTFSEQNNLDVREIKNENGNQERRNSQKSGKDFTTTEKEPIAINLENKDSSEMMIEKETNINLIKNIDNNFNNINAINIKTAKANQINHDQKNVLRAVHNNINHNFNKFENKLNPDANPKADERSTLRANAKIIRPQMSPSHDSDRTIVQFNEKNVNLDNLEMNYLLGEQNESKPELKASNTENFRLTIDNPTVFMDEVGKKQNVRLDDKLGGAPKESKTSTQKNERILDDEINKDKPKCLIF